MIPARRLAVGIEHAGIVFDKGRPRYFLSERRRFPLRRGKHIRRHGERPGDALAGVCVRC